MHQYVDISRRFRDLTKAELEEPELLASFNEHDFPSPTDWPELLRHPRVLLLAEAGSGKTAEMREQAKHLATEGKFAFFVPLESLDRDNLTDLLSAEEGRAFDAWKADGHSTAWFFLDAVDELKLNQGKLERALGRFAKAVDGLLDRVHVVTSCRPSDWRPLLDMATLQARLPLARTAKTSTTTPPDEVFLAALRKEAGMKQEQEESVEAQGVRTVVLLPMSERQIETFSRGLGVKDPAAFIAEIHKQNAWIFARRPLDLSELVVTWKASGQLGTRAQQHETNIVVKLKDDPGRPDRGVLSDIRARLGAERLALALALTRTRTIRSPEQALDIDRAEGVLNPAEVLSDWDEDERQTLLRRALFDPATYGRVRFHHRSVQEYLAACRLKNLRDKGMPINALLRLFFAERYGEKIVIPSMRAIAAWLALWNEDIRRELIAREPETLLSLGDPETLPIGARVSLVKAFVNTYGEGGWRGLNIPLDEVRRLAHPELAYVIRETWGNGPTNDDVRELLLKLIWQGAIEGCADLAGAAAENVDYSPYHRIAAVRALFACGRIQAARSIADSILREPAKWPDKVVHSVARDLFPNIITATELVVLVERTREPKSTVGGFAWALRDIATAADPWSEAAVQLREKLADLIWRGRDDRQEWYRIKGRFDYVAPALAILCDRQLSVANAKHDNDLIRACVIANRFGDDETSAGEPIGELKRHFKEGSLLREKAFWAELDLMDELTQGKDDEHRLLGVEHNGLAGDLTASDRAWLETALTDRSFPKRRPVVLHALIRQWFQRGRIGAEFDALREAVADDVSLTEEASRRTAPIEPNTELRKLERHIRRRHCVREAREKRRLADWTKWREDLLSDPNTAFNPENLGLTVSNLHKWLTARTECQSRSNVWNQDALAQVFGADIAQRAASAFKSFWRTTVPTLWSARPAGERNSTPWLWIYGLCGLSAEATSPKWAIRLTAAEARIAAAYATVELNGFSSWLGDLAVAHPSEVDATLGVELAAELAMGADYQHLPVLQDLTYADITVKQLLAPRCLAALTTWPTTFTDAEAGQRSAHNLDQVLRILFEAGEEKGRIAIASQCDARFAADPAGPLALIWLRGLFRLDAERGAKALEAGLTAIDDPARIGRAVETLAALFGDRESVLIDIVDLSARAAVLGRLVRCAYKYVRHEDDQEHEGVYSPNTRDKAEEARNFLLSALLDTPGAHARKVILELATEPNFGHFPDRLRILARQRAASDAEFVACSASDLAALDLRLEVSPHDRDGLFNVMKDRLDDLSHDVAHDDFTDRRTLRTIQDESEMQRTLARRLKEMARGAYLVSREEEVADQKRTDIRMASVRGDQKAVIEIKIADERWSLADLERSLRNQLVGQYLRHESSKAGCFLLTYDGTKKNWEHPETSTRLSFAETVDYLGTVAKQIEHDEAHGVRLMVHVLDLTGPILRPVHR